MPQLKGIQKSQGFVVTNNNPAQNGFPCPDVNAVYGPYRSLESAYQGCLEVFGSPTSIPTGVTVGVIIENKIEDYWFEKENDGIGYFRYDLVPKGTVIDGVKKQITLSESNWNAIESSETLLKEFCEKYDGWALDVTEDKASDSWRFGDSFPIAFS